MPVTRPPSARIASWSVHTAALAALLAAPAGAVPRHAFVTSTTGSGQLSTWAETNAEGLAGGDQICQVRAAAASPALANPTSYRAWLSTPATDAYCHLFNFTGESPTCGGQNPNLGQMGPWIRLDGEPFAKVFADLIGAEKALLQPVLYDENGDAVTGTKDVWTGTSDTGEELGNLTCSGWSSTAGNGAFGYADRVARGWTYSSSQSCAAAKRLLCFEPGAGERVAPPAVGGALAFVSSTTGQGGFATWPETNSNGITGGDEICRARAAAAFLPNASSFVALLSDTTTDAVDRITFPGPFLRTDGFVLVDLADDLFSSPYLLTGLDVTELRTYLGNTADGVWTGSTASGLPVVNHCFDWSSSEVGASGGLGAYGGISSIWLTGSSNNCSNAQRLYCFSNVDVLFWDNFERGDTDRWSDIAF